MEIIAYHEAGHAVIEYLSGYPLTGIKVNPFEEYGECPYSCQSNVEVLTPELQGITETEKHILIYCGGSAAEYILTNTLPNWHQSQDYADAVNELVPIYKDKKLIAAYIEAVFDWSVDLLKQYWDVVETLANSLVWYSTEPDSENDWYGNEMVELLPEDFWEQKPGLREMDRREAEKIIRHALADYAQTHKS
jgi:hypothetical protein